MNIDQELLFKLKYQMDPEADALADHYLDRPPHELFHTVLGVNHSTGDTSDNHVADWLDRRPELPDFADSARLDNGVQFFAQWGIELGIGLFLSSLPLAYASHDGAQVLGLTARLETDARRRVLESAQFLLDVTAPAALEPGAQGYNTARRVRLMHAGVRHMILSPNGKVIQTTDPNVTPRWDPGWGNPINQQHLLGAMLSFSSSLLHVLDTLGVAYDQQGAEDYCHLWNVVGGLLGIDPDLLPLGRAEMDVLEKMIRADNERESDAGVLLTSALMDLVNSFNPTGLFRGLPPALMRRFIGDKTADLLGVPQTKWSRALVSLFVWEERWGSRLRTKNVLTRRMARWVSLRILNGFVEIERHGPRPQFNIPDHLSPAIEQQTVGTRLRGLLPSKNS